MYLNNNNTTNTTNTNLIVEEIYEIECISNTIYTIWFLNKPTVISKLLTILKPSTIMDIELSVSTENYRITLTIFEDEIVIHSITNKSTENTIRCDKSFNIQRLDKDAFIHRFKTTFIHQTNNSNK